jgi:type IV pilus assembly protein PilA
MGVLVTIALPSLFSQIRKAREARAQNMVGAVNRAQQAYRLDSSSFAGDLTQLRVSLPAVSEQYNYAFGVITESLAEYKAAPVNADLRAFTGCATASGGLNATTGMAILETPAGISTQATPPTCP